MQYLPEAKALKSADPSKSAMVIAWSGQERVVVKTQSSCREISTKNLELRMADTIFPSSPTERLC
jgi:hypothetical protein